MLHCGRRCLNPMRLYVISQATIRKIEKESFQGIWCFLFLMWTDTFKWPSAGLRVYFDCGYTNSFTPLIVFVSVQFPSRLTVSSQLPYHFVIFTLDIEYWLSLWEQRLNIFDKGERCWLQSSPSRRRFIDVLSLLPFISVHWDHIHRRNLKVFCVLQWRKKKLMSWKKFVEYIHLQFKKKILLE